jgi:uncharacterized protein
VTEEEIINEAWKVAHAFLDSGNHDIGHVKRVLRNATLIWEKEGGNLFAIKLSAILHDIGRPIEDLTGWDHAEVSANIAKRLLYLWNIPDKIIKIVYDAIYNHRFSKGRTPQTIEGKILSDADKLDALGAIGIAMVFKHDCGRAIEDDIKHFYEKIVKLPHLMYTEAGYKLAIERLKVVEYFLEQIQKELNSENQ